MITKNTKIEDVVKEAAEMMAYFNEQRIDYCCNGFMTLEEVAQEKSLDTQVLVAEVGQALEEAKKAPAKKTDISLEDFKKLDLQGMIHSILEDHHEKERAYLFDIDHLLNKILVVHYEHHGADLLKLHDLFADLKKELEVHFIKEEKITFPLMLANPQPSQAILDEIQELEADHENAGDLIKAMIDLTDGFTPPKDACTSFKRTYEQLDQLTKDVFVHIFKENSLLFELYKAKRSA